MSRERGFRFQILKKKMVSCGMRLLVITAVVGAFLVECSDEKDAPPPPIKPAPGHLASLSIHVHNASQYAAREAEEDVASATIYLRGAIQRSLVRAGYRVVVSPDEPRDLTARVSADWPFDKPGTATLSFVDREGAMVDQLSGLVVFDENYDIDERSAVQLVQAMAHSPKLARFGRELQRRAGNRPPPPSVPVPVPQIATDPAPEEPAGPLTGPPDPQPQR